MKSETILLGSCLRRIDTLQKRDLISRQRDARVLTKLQIVAQNEGVPITNGRIIVPSLVHSGLKTLCRRDQVNQKVYVLLLCQRNIVQHGNVSLQVLAHEFEACFHDAEDVRLPPRLVSVCGDKDLPVVPKQLEPPGSELKRLAG